MSGVEYAGREAEAVVLWLDNDRAGLERMRHLAGGVLAGLDGTDMAESVGILAGLIESYVSGRLAPLQLPNGRGVQLTIEQWSVRESIGRLALVDWRATARYYLADVQEQRQEETEERSGMETCPREAQS